MTPDRRFPSTDIRSDTPETVSPDVPADASSDGSGATPPTAVSLDGSGTVPTTVPVQLDTVPPVRQRATRRDVARRAGVSETTVSLVLNPDRPRHRISEETQARVRAVAAEIGYFPHTLIRSLRKRQSNLIAFGIGHDQFRGPDGFWSQLILSVEEAIMREGHRTLLISDYQNRPIETTLPYLLGGFADGILIVPEPEGDILMPHLINSSVPTITLLTPLPGLPVVRQAEEPGIMELLQHLLERGHREIAYLGMTRYPLDDNPRYKTYQRFLNQQGLENSAQRVLAANPSDPQTIDAVLRQLFTQSPRPTALLCYSDFLAYAALQSCHRLGIVVPSEFAITGFDGISFPFSPQPLTSYAVSLPELAQTAVSHLLNRIQGQSIPVETLIPGTLVPGDTT